MPQRRKRKQTYLVSKENDQNMFKTSQNLIENNTFKPTTINENDQNNCYESSPQNGGRTRSSTSVLRVNKTALNKKSIDSSDTNHNRKPSNIDIKPVHYANSIILSFFEQHNSNFIILVDQLFNNAKKSIRLHTTNLLHTIFQLLIKASGCEGEISHKNIISDNYEILFDDLSEHFPSDIGSFYPIINNSDKKFKYFKNNFNKFTIILCKKCESTQMIFNHDFMYYLVSYINCMSNSNIRAFRHTATFFGMKMMTWIGIMLDEYNVLDTQYDLPSNKRMMDLKKILQDNVNRLFSGIFIHRLHDITVDIRTLCVYQLGICINQNKLDFLNSNYLKYIGMALYDKAASIRVNAIIIIKTLLNDYPNIQNTSNNYDKCMALFMCRFETKLITMINDSNINIALSAIEIICEMLCYNYVTLELEHFSQPNILIDSIGILMENFDNLKCRQKFVKYLSKLVSYIILISTLKSLKINPIDNNWKKYIEDFDMVSYKEPILNCCVLFLISVTYKDNLLKTRLYNCLDCIYISNISKIVGNYDLIVYILLLPTISTTITLEDDNYSDIHCTKQEIIYLHIINYIICNNTLNRSDIFLLLDNYSNNILGKYHTESAHVGIILDIINNAIEKYSILLTLDQSESITYESNQQINLIDNNSVNHYDDSCKMIEKLCLSLQEIILLIYNQMDNYIKIIEIFQLIDEKFTGTLSVSYGLIAIKHEFNRFTHILLNQVFQPPPHDSIHNNIDSIFNITTNNYLLKYNYLLHGYNPNVFIVNNDSCDDDDNKSIIEKFMIFLSDIFQNQHFQQLRSNCLNQEITINLLKNILLHLMWYFVSNPVNSDFSVSSTITQLNDQPTIKNHVDKYIDLVTIPWNEKSYRLTHNYIYHEVFKLIRDLCLLLVRAYGSYSTTYQHLFSLQKIYILDLLSIDLDIDEKNIIETNFQGFIEYINFGLLNCFDLTTILLNLVTTNHNHTLKYIEIFNNVFLKYINQNKEKFFHNIITGILRIVHEQISNSTSDLIADIIPTIAHAQKISSILSEIIPKHEIKNDVYRKHHKLLICDSIDYSLQDDDNKNTYPNITFLYCFTPFVGKLTEIDRLGKYGILNYFNDKLKKSNYKRKRCPIIKHFREVLKNSKYISNDISSTASKLQITTIDEDTPDLSKYIDCCITNNDCSEITMPKDYAVCYQPDDDNVIPSFTLK